MPSPTARRSSVLLLALLAAALAPRADAAQDRPARAVPALPRPPKLDGELKDFRGGLSLKKAQGDTASIVPMVAFSRDVLLLAVTLTDDDLQPNDTLDVTLFFPGAGTTAQGHAFRFSADGQRTPDAETAAPVFAQQLVRSGVKRTKDGFALELAIPARALPRFPARDALLLDLCLTSSSARPGASTPRTRRITSRSRTWFASAGPGWRRRAATTPNGNEAERTQSPRRRRTRGRRCAPFRSGTRRGRTPLHRASSAAERSGARTV